MAKTQDPETYDKVLKRNVAQLKDDVRRKASGEKVLRHVPTGFTAIDAAFGGLRIGVVTEILAHTGDGKSAFLRQLAEGAATSGAGVLWVVGEDPEDATVERQLSGDTGIDTAQIGRLDLSEQELQRLDLASQRAVGWANRILPVFEHHDVDSVLELIDETRTVGGHELGVVLLDYAQVFGVSRNLEDDIARLGEGLRARSRQRKFATAISSQVANEVIKRGRDRWLSARDIRAIRPSLGDTEWCRRLEKSSKAVWSLIRPGRWLREWGEPDAVDDYAELHVSKQNFGGMGWVELGWDGSTTRFLNK